MNLQLYPGWTGMHSRDEASGAMPNGTRVHKVKMERGDAHPIGSMATVLGSISHPDIVGIGYFVEWDAKPRRAVFVMSAKIALQ